MSAQKWRTETHTLAQADSLLVDPHNTVALKVDALRPHAGHALRLLSHSLDFRLRLDTVIDSI